MLGASLPSIFLLINRQYLPLILFALIISIPFTAYIVNKWLEDFSFHIDVTWDVFVIAGLTMTLLSLLSVGYLAIKAALSNPIEAIEDE